MNKALQTLTCCNHLVSIYYLACCYHIILFNITPKYKLAFHINYYLLVKDLSH